jgi:hypothetical protein
VSRKRIEKGPGASQGPAEWPSLTFRTQVQWVGSYGSSAPEADRAGERMCCVVTSKGQIVSSLDRGLAKPQGL